MESSWQGKFPRVESKRSPFYKEFWSQPPVDPVFGETGIGCGEKISWEVLSPGDSQTYGQMESEGRSKVVRQLESDRHLRCSAWRPEDDTDKSCRENRYGYHMDPFEDENFTRRRCSNNFKLHDEKLGNDEDIGSGNESEGGALERHEGDEHCRRGPGGGTNEKELHHHIRKVRTFPPLISSFPSNNSLLFSHVTPLVLLKSLRSKGRLVLQEAKVVAPAMFQPIRRDGRLLLQLPRQDDCQHLAMKVGAETLDLENEDAVIKDNSFDAACAFENKEFLETLSNMKQDVPEPIKQCPVESYNGFSVLCTHCRRELNQIDFHSEGSSVGFDRQYSGKFCTECVGESKYNLYPMKNEVKDYPLPEKNSVKIAWPKVCGDMIVNDMQATPVTNSEQVAGQLNLTKPAYEGRCYYPKERSINWHLAATRATKV